MVVLTKGSLEDLVRLTLTENQTIVAVSYKIVFTQRGTKEVVTVTGLQDASEYPDRYNKFSINTSVSFAGKTEGFWDYAAYAVGPTVELLEEGTMKLLPETNFTYKSHAVATEYKIHKG